MTFLALAHGFASSNLNPLYDITKHISICINIMNFVLLYIQNPPKKIHLILTLQFEQTPLLSLQQNSYSLYRIIKCKRIVDNKSFALNYLQRDYLFNNFVVPIHIIAQHTS